MKILLLFTFLVAAGASYAETKMVPLDMQLGYWETETEIIENDALKKMLENVPEAQRAMMRDMLASNMKIPASKQCITKDSFNDLEKKMQETLAAQTKGENCKFDVISSSKKAFSGKLVCENMQAMINTKVINAKRNESTAVSTMEGMGNTKLKMVAQWKSAACPEN